MNSIIIVEEYIKAFDKTISMLRRHADELERTKNNLRDQLEVQDEIALINRQAAEAALAKEDIRGLK